MLYVNKMCLSFIDWQKASDHEDWNKLMEILKTLELTGGMSIHLEFIHVAKGEIAPQSIGNQLYGNWKERLLIS